MSGNSQVTTTQEGRWQSSMDGATETRTSFGTSAHGNHYAVEVSYLGSDGSDGERAWSRPFASMAEAERMGGSVSERARGDILRATVMQPITQAQRDAARSQASPAQPASSGQTAQAEAQRERAPTL